MIPRSALRGIQALRDAEDAALAQGFADCEALVVAMLVSMAREKSAPALRVVAKILTEAFPLPSDSRISAATSAIVDALFSSAALAVSLGQHRTDAYNPDVLAKAHASALGRRGASKGGSAGTDAQNSARRANARKTKGLRFRCAECGKETAGRLPKGGSGDYYWPRKHRDSSGKVCEGVYREAEWLKTP